MNKFKIKRLILDKFNMKEVDENELTFSNIYYKFIGDFKYWLYSKGYAPKYWDRQIKYILQIADKKCAKTGTCKCGCDLIKMILSGKQCEDKCYMWLNKKEFRALEINLMSLKLHNKQNELNQLPTISDFIPLKHSEITAQSELTGGTETSFTDAYKTISTSKTDLDNKIVDVKSNNKVNIEKTKLLKSAPTMETKKETVFNLKYITDSNKSKYSKTFNLNLAPYTVTEDGAIVPFSFILKMKNIEVDKVITKSCECTETELEIIDADSVRIKGGIKTFSIKAIENYPDKTVNKSINLGIKFKELNTQNKLQHITVNIKIDFKL